MLYFLVKKGNELHVTPVLPVEEDLIRLLHHEYILVEGTSLQDVLRQFLDIPTVTFHAESALEYAQRLHESGQIVCGGRGIADVGLRAAGEPPAAGSAAAAARDASPAAA